MFLERLRSSNWPLPRLINVFRCEMEKRETNDDRDKCVRHDDSQKTFEPGFYSFFVFPEIFAIFFLTMHDAILRTT